MQTKSGYFAFDHIFPLQAILPFNVFVCLQNWLICCSAHKYCFGVLIVTVWIVILTMNKMGRSLNLCWQGTQTEAVYIKEGMAVCGYERECKLKAPFLLNHFLSILIHYRD